MQFNIKDDILKGAMLSSYPEEWKTQLRNAYILQYRNLDHFKRSMSFLKLKSSSFENVTYEQCVADLKGGIGQIPQGEYDLIKQKVKENLLAKRLISKDIYRGYEYATEGDTIDVARLAAGNPECCVRPKFERKVSFYELFINTAVLGSVSENSIKKRLSKLLATIELLEEEGIYIKLNGITFSRDVSEHPSVPKRDVCVVIPVFSHKEKKSITKLSSVINSRLQRKFSFAIRETVYGDKLSYGYGRATSLDKCINLKDPLDECHLAQDIIDRVIVKCEGR